MDLNLEGKFLDKVKSGISKGVSTYNYLSGKNKDNLNLDKLVRAKDSEISSCKDLDTLVKSFKKAKQDIEVKINDNGNGNAFLVTFSAASVPTEVADDLRKGGKFYPYIKQYDKDSGTVKMLFTKDNSEDKTDKDGSRTESCMAPTPTPYKGRRSKMKESVDDSGYELIDYKTVKDSDGFNTDYTWYRRLEDGMNVFVFGDQDYYTPEDADFDFETESDSEAQEWFDSYRGFEDEDDYYFRESKNPFKDTHICKGCGNPLSKCTCEIPESLKEDYYDDFYKVLDNCKDLVERASHAYRQLSERYPDNVSEILDQMVGVKNLLVSTYDELKGIDEDLSSSSATQPSGVGQYKRDSLLDMFR